MTKLNPYEDTGRIHRRKGYAINQRFFLAARYTLENKRIICAATLLPAAISMIGQATLLMRTMTITRKEIGYAKLITVSVRNVYGVETVYPACPDSVIFAGIAGTKTLTADTLARIERLGYDIRVENA